MRCTGVLSATKHAGETPALRLAQPAPNTLLVSTGICRKTRVSSLEGVLPYEEFVLIQQRLADAEDLLELRKAKGAEGRKTGITIAEAKRKLGLG